MEEIKESIEFAILLIVFVLVIGISRVVIKVHHITEEVQTTLVDIKRDFIGKAAVLSTESIDYIREEYSEEGKDILQQTIDSTKSNLIKILKQ